MKKVIALLALVLASAALAACGSSDSSTTEAEAGGSTEAAAEAGSTGAGSTVQIATPSGTELAYTTDEASAKAGKVTIEFENAQELKHDVAIEDSSGKVLTETELIADGSAVATADLKPGEYTFFCTVPGHRQAGMEGTLTVE